MPYPPEHKQETREHILKTARRLFSRHGLSEVTIDQLMAEAGLTRGGFYKHFETKEHLYSEAIRQFACDTPPQWQLAHVKPGSESKDFIRMIINAYLSEEHLEDKDSPCPMIGLPTDVSRCNGTVKAAYQSILEMMIGAFTSNMPGDEEKSRERALASAALCVGRMVLARAVNDKSLGDEIRDAARKEVLAMVSAEAGPWKARAI